MDSTLEEEIKLLDNLADENRCPCVEHKQFGIGFHVGNRRGYRYVFFDSDLDATHPKAKKFNAKIVGHLLPTTQHSKMCKERLVDNVYFDAQKQEYLLSHKPLAREMKWHDLVAAVHALRSQRSELVNSDAIRSWCAAETPPVSPWAEGETCNQEAFWDADESAARIGNNVLLKFKESATDLTSTNYWALRANGQAARNEALGRGLVEVPWNSKGIGRNGHRGKWEATRSQKPDPKLTDSILAIS